MNYQIYVYTHILHGMMRTSYNIISFCLIKLTVLRHYISPVTSSIGEELCRYKID